MNGFPDRLLLPETIWRAVLAHAQSCLPEEACGLMGGTADQVARFLPVENALHSPVRFSMEPAAQLKAMLLLEEQGLELLAIVHSHPAGPDHPSATDLAEFGYPGVLSLILSPSGLPDGWQARVFAIEGVFSTQSPVREVPAERIPAQQPGPAARNPTGDEGLF